MNRWVSLIREDDENPEQPNAQLEPIENEAELVGLLIVPGPRKWSRNRRAKKGSFGIGSKHKTEADRKAHIRTLLRKLQGHNFPDSSGSDQVGRAPAISKHRNRKRPSVGGRPRHDFERYAAVLLAEIFHEYTNNKPTRPNAELGRSAFYDFAGACFAEIGLIVREFAFREATEVWQTAYHYDRPMMHQLLWGQLILPDDNRSMMNWSERELHPRKNSPS